ncbi:glycoside hydrolase family 92 protein [Colletotrichum kahawae]|uniref:Glycoside hydrolase family 92 protein n=1 Tax=Colletotrichum kahawae TaxID=34407 RepID=A0AAD9XXJ7_COLKA|nr:glycoside hydrolase family 92 protein [Colletotrichum kahawae]
MFWSSQVITAVVLSGVSAADITPGPLTQHVNIFTGTAQNDDPGNVFAGAATPFGMAKVTVQVAGYAPAGYVSVSTELTRGVSPLHDSGTGSSAGSYGNFCIMPVVCNEFLDCPRLEQPRAQRRVGDGNNDTGFPGYFSTPLANGVRIELASTQAASIERYTFPEGSTPTLVLDWTDDSQHSFLHGEMYADWKSQRLMMNGTYRSSFGPSQFTYTAFQCVDLSVAGTSTDHAFFGGNANGMNAVRADLDRWILPPIAQRLGRPDFEQPTQAGAIVRFKPSSDQKDSIIVRRGVSYTSADTACKNIKRELPGTDFNKIVAASNAMWEDRLGRIILSDDTTDPIRKLFYTSFYRTFLSPNNATGNAPPPYTDSSHPYFDGLYCSWDYEGRRIETYNKMGYIAYDYLDTASVGQRSREASRGLEYAFGDFAVGMVARVLKQPTPVSDRYFNRSLSYRNNFNPNLQSDGFSNFVARMFENGTFAPSNPTDCSPRDSNTTRPCSTQATNTFGIYESSSWEYSLYAPHDVKGLVDLLGGNKTFEDRLHHFFDAGYYLPGNEPNFQTPSLFHHIGKPAESVQQVRRIVYDNFNLTRGGLPGNDDNAAMASLLTWYLLGFYPVPASGEMLVLSPFMPGYVVKNELMGTINVKVTGFDPASLARNIPPGARAYVETVKLDGVAKGRCRIDFKQFFAAKEVEFVMADAKKDGCDGQEPSSLSADGFPL